MSARRTRDLLKRRGSVAMVALFSLPAMISLGALTVDVGLLSLRTAEAQNVSDAAALGASMRLDGTSWGVYRARKTASAVAKRNTVGGESVTIDMWQDVQFGRIADGAFVYEEDPSEITAVRVDIRDVPVPALFSKAIRGERPYYVSGDAVATGNDPVDPMTIPYVLPLSMPYCVIEQANNEQLQSLVASLSGGNVPMQWTSADWYPYPATLDDIVEPLVEDCLYATEESLDSWACRSVTVGDWTMSRPHSGSGYVDVVAGIARAGTRYSDDTWDTTLFGTRPAAVKGSAFANAPGKVISGPVLLLDNDYCSTGSYPTWSQVAGFVWVEIYEAKATQATSTTAASSNLWARIDMTTVRLIGVGESDGPEVGGSVLALSGSRLVH